MTFRSSSVVRWAAGARCSFFELASEPPAEAGHFEMVLDDGLPGRGILETSVAFRRAAVMLTKLTPISKMRRINPSASSG